LTEIIPLADNCHFASRYLAASCMLHALWLLLDWDCEFFRRAIIFRLVKPQLSCMEFL